MKRERKAEPRLRTNRKEDKNQKYGRLMQKRFRIIAVIFGVCLAALVVGLLLYAFVLGVSGRYLSKIVGGTCNALVATLLCVVCWRMGFGLTARCMVVW